MIMLVAAGSREVVAYERENNDPIIQTKYFAYKHSCVNA